MIAEGKKFKHYWQKLFGLEKTTTQALRAHLDNLAFPDSRDLELCLFLFRDLPKLFPENPSESWMKTATAYARFCFAFWQSKNVFIPFPQDYAAFLKSALCGEREILDPEIFAIAELAGTPEKREQCGFNTFAFRDAERLRGNAWLSRNGDYEEFLTESAQAKYEEYRQALNNSPEFSKDWEMLKALYPDYKKLGSEFVLHRRALPERGWARGQGSALEATPEEAFRSAFDLFCWKYYLWGIDLVKDRPLLLKPSVNITPFGTQIFIPAYMSYDARRDFVHSRIAELHKAKGVRRQGKAFSTSRTESKELARRAKQLHTFGRQQGLRGNALLDFVAEKIALPEIDYRSLRRLLKSAD